MTNAAARAISPTRLETTPRFTRTDIGILPTDWELRELQDVCREPITYGIVQCGPHLPGGIPYIRVSDMEERDLNPATMLRTAPEIAKRFSRSTVAEGDIVYALRGKLGEVRRIGADVAGANLTQGTARLSPGEGIRSCFLLWILRSQPSLRQAELQAKGTTFREITLADLRSLKIPVPAEREQDAIAEALNDANALVESLEQLIAKKRAIKRGAMQELLTGKSRLPNFRPKWQAKPLFDIAPLQRGFDLPNAQLRRGPYPVVYSNGVLNYHASYQVRGPGVVTGRSGTIGTVTFVGSDYWPHNTSLWVTSFNGNDPKFVFYLYTLIGFERFATGSGVPTLNRNDLHSYRTKLPTEVEEQRAIATILADMDTELDQLHAKLDKARHLKQGMVRELLTGKVRLV